MPLSFPILVERFDVNFTSWTSEHYNVQFSIQNVLKEIFDQALKHYLNIEKVYKTLKNKNSMIGCDCKSALNIKICCVCTLAKPILSNI